MWTMWLFPLVICLLLFGAMSSILWFFTSRKDSRPRILTVVAVPFGCAGVPVIGLLLLSAASAFFQKSDAQLYKEAFGYRPTIDEDRMLFDDFGNGAKREIFMKAEPTNDERSILLTIPGLVQSEFTLDQFIARGAQHGFMWWFRLIQVTHATANQLESLMLLSTEAGSNSELPNASMLAPDLLQTSA